MNTKVIQRTDMKLWLTGLHKTQPGPKAKPSTQQLFTKPAPSSQKHEYTAKFAAEKQSASVTVAVMCHSDVAAMRAQDATEMAGHAAVTDAVVLERWVGVGRGGKDV